MSTVLGGLNEENPADSCQQISENRPDLSSGNYWITSANGTVVQVYCDMDRQCCNESKGTFTRIANLDMTDPNQQRPPAWTLITSPVRTCGRSSTGNRTCDSAIFPANGTAYSRVCGRVKAYQVGWTEAFRGYNNYGLTNIDSNYVDGVSITHGSPRKHVWSFASAYYGQERFFTGAYICPCTNSDNPNIANFHIPHFIGNDYFCETGTETFPSGGEFYSNNPLWDGEGCGPTSTCCELGNPPWFCKQLPAPTSDDIEVRICCLDSIDGANIAIEQIEMYIL